MAMKAVNSGMIIIGGGVIKHHICNANLMVSIFYLGILSLKNAHKIQEFH